MKQLLCLSLVLCFCSALSARAQGLLGQKYIYAGYTLASPNDNTLRAISQWSHGLDVQMRRPLSEKFDWLVDTRFAWFGGSTVISSVPMEFDSDFTVLSTSVSYNYAPVELPIGTLRFFNNLGVSYANFNAETRAGIIAVSDSDDDFGLQSRNGFELRFSESTSLLANMITDYSLFDSEADDDLFEGLEFRADFVHWWGPHFFSGFLIGSDFDNTEITLGGYLGLGNW